MGKACIVKIDPEIAKQPIVIPQPDGTSQANPQLTLEEMRDGTAFNRKWNREYFIKALEQAGYDGLGKERVMNGETGEYLHCDIMVAPVYYQALKHMVKYKLHARSNGPYTVLQRQPVEGRANEGGIRLGEMERDCLAANGASFFLHDSWMERCDKFMMYVCATCGMIAIANQETSQKWCRSCSHDQTKLIKTYYITKLLAQQLYGMCVGMRFLTQGNAPLELDQKPTEEMTKLINALDSTKIN